MAQMLPRETIRDIFLLTTPSLVTNRDTDIIPLTIPPLNYSAVCRFWREVVESEPDLWSSIHVVQRDRTKPLNRSTIRFVQTWLEKSGMSSLDIRLDLHHIAGDHVGDQLLDVLLPTFRRWEKVVMQITTGYLPITLQCSPSTKSLTFTGFGEATPHAFLDLQTSETIPSIVSQLQELSLSPSVKMRFPSGRDALHLPNLRNLCFSISQDSNLDDALGLLSACPNLAALFVTTFETDPFNMSPHGPVQLSRLTKMTIIASSNTTPYQLLDNLRCPLLQSFAFRVTMQVGTDYDIQAEFVNHQDLEHFTNFFRRSRFESTSLPLTDLSIRYFPGKIPSEQLSPCIHELEEMLALLGSLKHLELRGMVIDDGIIKALTLGDDVERNRFNFALCPVLTEMLFVCETDFGMRKGSVERMVVSRWTADENLREIVFRVPGFENFGKENKRVADCIQEGLKFQFQPGPPKRR